MNVLHLHLSDDQGWRIEIKSWPKLTEIGGSTEVGGGEGGFYTQKQFMEIVNYAKERFITIIPEIEIPGHSNAALASYAELNCDGKVRELYTGTKVGFSTVCTQNEITYQFVDDVIRELSAISPGPYIHIGGDESLSTEKEDYIYFLNRVQDIVIAHGKQMIGWEEIAQADLEPGTIVQFWANEKYAALAVEKGAKLIMSPGKKIYLDMKYDSTSPLGLHWAGYIEVDTAYIWDPSVYVDGITEKNILGIEAPLWTETITSMNDIEYMLFPRMPGYAEIGWSSKSNRDWNEYKKRLVQHGKRFEAMDINYYPSRKVNWIK
jgi:hexosaminidase